jgi:hypothetical protein
LFLYGGIIISFFPQFRVFRCSLLLRAVRSRHFLTTWLNCLSDCKDLRTFPTPNVILRRCAKKRKSSLFFFFFPLSIDKKVAFVFSARWQPDARLSLVVATLICPKPPEDTHLNSIFCSHTHETCQRTFQYP